MKELWHGTDNYVSPWDIKKIIAEVASQVNQYFFSNFLMMKIV